MNPPTIGLRGCRICWEMERIQNEYIRNADITINWEDIRNAYMNELSEMAIKLMERMVIL